MQSQYILLGHYYIGIFTFKSNIKMKPLFNIKLILLISLCAVINVLISQEDKVMPGEFITWEEKIPLENPKWATGLKDFDGCRSLCGAHCQGKHKGVSFCAGIMQRKDDPGRDPVKLILVHILKQ